ncbi:MAG: zinc ribbon domain-containing protein [Verrucomicrobiaceae bacterium]
MSNTSCIQCGQPIVVGDKFCEHCGAAQAAAPPVTPAHPPPKSALGVILLSILGIVAVAGGGIWLFTQWKRSARSEIAPQSPPSKNTGIPVPYGKTGDITPPPLSLSPSITDLAVIPWAQSPDGRLGISVTATPVGLPGNDGTRFNGWVKDSNGNAIATLDRDQRSPDGGLGFQAPAANGVLSGFIPARAIGLPPGDHALRVEVQAANGGVLSQPAAADFLFRMMACHPDRLQVDNSIDPSGRRMVHLTFDITATPLTGQMGSFLLRFKRADTREFIPCNDPQYSGHGLLSVGYRFQMPAYNTILDGVPIVIPFDLFPDTDCLVDIEFYDTSSQKLNWLNNLRFHPRG